LRREDYVLNAMALIVEHYVEDFVVLAVDRVAVEGVDGYILAVRVLVARLGKFRLFGGEALDDVLGRGSGGGIILERAFLSARRPSR
jgi:hypothetical protein